MLSSALICTIFQKKLTSSVKYPKKNADKLAGFPHKKSRTCQNHTENHCGN